MGITKGECIRVTQKLVERVCHGDIQWIRDHTYGFQCRISAHDEFAHIMQVKMNEKIKRLSKNVTDISHMDYHAAFYQGEHAMVSGIFLTYHIVLTSFRAER